MDRFKVKVSLKHASTGGADHSFCLCVLSAKRQLFPLATSCFPVPAVSRCANLLPKSLPAEPKNF